MSIYRLKRSKNTMMILKETQMDQRSVGFLMSNLYLMRNLFIRVHSSNISFRKWSLQMNLLLWNSICRNSLNYLYLILFSQRLTNHKSQQNYREKRLISSQNSAIFQKKCSKAQRKKKMNTRLISNKFKKL